MVIKLDIENNKSANYRYQTIFIANDFSSGNIIITIIINDDPTKDNNDKHITKITISLSFIGSKYSATGTSSDISHFIKKLLIF